jgi:hypothetical protein
MKVRNSKFRNCRFELFLELFLLIVQNNFINFCELNFPFRVIEELSEIEPVIISAIGLGVI